MLAISCEKADNNDPTAVKDADGNTYHTVTIGTQEWMVENLKTTKYSDGTAIPLVTDNTDWSDLSTPGYCYYNNDNATYKNVYGALYNFYTISTGKLCPTGWHVPTDSEWTTLITFVGGENVAGGKLKELGTAHWNSPNTGAINENGFTALPGGSRDRSNGTFSGVGSSGYWWSSTVVGGTDAYIRLMTSTGEGVSRYRTIGMKGGRSVRCVKD